MTLLIVYSWKKIQMIFLFHFTSYTVKVTDDHLATIQMSTSKPDALFQLCILDNGSVIYHVEGKGHAVLPAVIFFKDPVDDETLSISSSKECKPFVFSGFFFSYTHTHTHTQVLLTWNNFLSYIQNFFHAQIFLIMDVWWIFF